MDPKNLPSIDANLFFSFWNLCNLIWIKYQKNNNYMNSFKIAIEDKNAKGMIETPINTNVVTLQQETLSYSNKTPFS